MKARAVRALPHHRSLVDARAAFSARLRERRAEIEEAAQARVRAVSDPADVADPEYLDGLRRAICAAIDYGFAGIECGERRPPPIPPLLLSQARLAARNGVSLDTVLRRYVAGYNLLGDFVQKEAEADPSLQGAPVGRLLREQAALFDQLLAAISEAHRCEMQRKPTSQRERRTEFVRRLLGGELLDASELAYDLDSHHCAMIAKGPGAEEAIRELTERLDRRLLLVSPGGDTFWAWLGGRRPLKPADLCQESIESATAFCIAVGENAAGRAGWRLTYRQAKAALPIAMRGPSTFVRYAEVAMLASILQDDLLLTSLREIYLVPLGDDEAGGALRGILRAWFACDRQVSSAAVKLGLSRQTVAKRLRMAESRLGRSLAACGLELDAALRVEELNATSTDRSIAHQIGNAMT